MRTANVYFEMCQSDFDYVVSDFDYGLWQMVSLVTVGDSRFGHDGLSWSVSVSSAQLQFISLKR